MLPLSLDVDRQVEYNIGMIKNCAVCTQPFRTYPSKVAQGRGKYCSRKCSDSITLIKEGQQLSPDTQFKKGQMPENFRGYTFTQSRKASGVYKKIYKPEHPFASKQGYVREHRLVMEEQLGRYLTSDEIVDHINMNTLDNRPENLRVMLKKQHDRMNTPLNIHRRWAERRPNPHAES